MKFKKFKVYYVRNVSIQSIQNMKIQRTRGLEEAISIDI